MDQAAERLRSGGPGPKAKVLAVDDDPDIAAVLRELLEGAGYKVETALDGETALARIASGAPDMVLLDVEMPGLSGWDVVERLRGDEMLRHLPVLFLTSRAAQIDKVKGLRLGGDDYVTKPFDPHELLARVSTLLRRVQNDIEANPLSLLPGNKSIEREIEGRIRAGARFAVLYADLNNFKALNDRYGFARGDEVIRATARLLLAARGEGDFVGHVGGDDFIVVTVPERAEAFCRRFIGEFESLAPSFYDLPDRVRGWIEVADRKGRLARFPLVAVAVGGVTNERRALTSLGQVSALGAETKKTAKRAERSHFVIDRRAN